MAWEGSDRRQELPANWSTLRLDTFRRDGYRCTHRDAYGQRCDGPAEECDHIVPGNDHRPENLRSLCSYHHGKKSGAEGARAMHAERRRHDRKFRRTEIHPGLL